MKLEYVKTSKDANTEKNDLAGNQVVKFIKNQEAFKFNIGDILIMQNRVWRTDKEEWVTKSTSYTTSTPTKYMYVFENEVGNRFSVGQYGNIVGIDQLKQKLAQYPKGTVFIARSEFGGYAQLQNVYTVLRPWAAMHGFELRLEQKKQGNTIIGSMF